jgi:phosphate transport system substrate-binding protein
MTGCRRFLGAAACAAALLARGHAAAAAAAPPDMAGVVRCAGGATMLPLVRSWGRQFRALHPGATVEVDPRVTLAADGFRALLAGQVDLVDFVREPFPAELAAFRQRFGYAPLLVNVANGSFATRGGTHAIAIYVNSSNPLRHLTLGQLDAIFAAAPRRNAGPPRTTWGGVGLKGSWADRPIHVYGMIPLRATGNPPGIVNFMEIRVLAGGSFRADLRTERDRPGESALQAIVRAVAKDPDGIGYSGFAYEIPGVKTVALAAHRGGPYVQIGPRQVADRSYPLSRRIYFALNSPPGRPLPPLLRAFIELALSPRGQRVISATPDRFLPLIPRQLARSRLQVRGNAVPIPRDSRAPPGSISAAEPYLTTNGAVAIIGYNDMREMLEALDRLFEREHPGIRFALTLQGTRTAPAALAAGRSLLAPMGAAFSPSELAAYRRRVGSDPIGFAIANDSLSPRARSAPLAIVVPAANPLQRLDFAQLERVFAAGERPLTWGELGVIGGLATRPVHSYGLASTTALGRFMRGHVLSGRAFSKRFVGLPESPEVVRAVSRDPLGIGFAAMNRATPAVRVVPLARWRGEPSSGGARVEVMDGRYPLDRHLLIYVRVAPQGHLDPLARAYLRLALSPQGQRAIASGHLGYRPLRGARAAAELAQVDALP